MSNHIHGLQFNIANSNLHLLLCILLVGDIATNPVAACISTGISSQNSQLKSLVLNARGLKSINRGEVSNQTVCNRQRFQNLVYNEKSDVICVSETWLNNSISNEDILHSGFTIYRKDRKDRYGGGVLVAIKTDSFKSVKEFSPNGEEFEDLEIVSAELRTVTEKNFLFCCCYRPPNADLGWMDKFKTFLDTICDLYENVVIAGDFNLPNIPWRSIEKAAGINELSFLKLLDDLYIETLIV